MDSRQRRVFKRMLENNLKRIGLVADEAPVAIQTEQPSAPQPGVRFDISSLLLACVVSILITLYAPAPGALYVQRIFWLLFCALLMVYPAPHFAIRMAARQSWNKLATEILMIAAVLGVGAWSAYFQWDHRPVNVKLIFKRSATLTASRQRSISREIDDYYFYLTNDVGFSLPLDIPPVELAKGNLIGAGATDPGITETSQLVIPENAGDDGHNVLAAFSHYTFDSLLYWHRYNDPSLEFRSASSWIYACYYEGSFFNQRDVCGGTEENWRNALWEVRAKLGKEYTDKLMFYSYRMWSNSTPPEKTFDVYFYDRLVSGLSVVTSDMRDRTTIKEILQRNGIAA
jgi:hypothetical protein